MAESVTPQKRRTGFVVNVPCLTCGATVVRRSSRVRGTGEVYCSQKCFRARTTPVERFRTFTEPGLGGCWDWTGSTASSKGYGQFWFEGRMVLAHRWSYEHYVGPIPEGLTIDHLCRNPECVNPAHLEPVTIGENIRRAHGRDHREPEGYDRQWMAYGGTL